MAKRKTKNEIDEKIQQVASAVDGGTDGNNDELYYKQNAFGGDDANNYNVKGGNSGGKPINNTDENGENDGYQYGNGSRNMTGENDVSTENVSEYGGNGNCENAEVDVGGSGGSCMLKLLKTLAEVGGGSYPPLRGGFRWVRNATRKRSAA